MSSSSGAPPGSSSSTGYGVEDYVVVAAMLAVSACIGIYYRLTGGRQKTTMEYLMADKSMSSIPVAFSLMSSFMSAISLMGLTREMYMYGTQFIMINIGYVLATPVAAYGFLPVFHRVQVTSVYEYLERRFNYVTRLLASLAFLFQMVLYMSIVLYAPAIAFSTVTGVTYLGSILSVGLVCTFYSTIGGMKAVLITDVFQSLLMFTSIISIVVIGHLRVGGITELISIASTGQRLEFFEMSLDPTVRHTFWSQVVGGCFLYASLYGVNQAQVQRLLSTPSLAKAQLSLWLQLPILCTLSFLTGLAGLYMYAFYVHCDPISAKRIDKADQLLPLIVVDTMQQFPGLPGFFVAGIFSGSLSTVSSAINSLAAVTYEDYIKPCLKTPMSDTRSAWLLKGLALAYGIVSVLFTFIVDYLGPSVLQASLTVFGLVGGPLLGVFTLGMMVPFANSVGAIAGLISSLAIMAWISFGQPRPVPQGLPLSTDNCTAFFNQSQPDYNLPTLPSNSSGSSSGDFLYPYEISYSWYTMIGWLIVLFVGSAISLVVNRADEMPVDPDLLIEPLRRNKLAEQGSKDDNSESQIVTKC